MKRTAWMVVVAAAVSSGCTTYFETPTSASTTATAPDPNIFSNVLPRGGSASRTFTLTAAGTIEATLIDVLPSVAVGVGVGLPRSDQAGCNVTRSVETVAGGSPQLAIQADAGTYCVKVFDMGHVREEATFTVRIAHP